MRSKARGFEPIIVSACSFQNLKTELREINEGFSGPAYWRNNLTALSQRHNLYFVAYQDVLEVFEPKFPNQNLSPSKSFSFDLHSSGPELTGYLNPDNPHSVNQLLVSDLGNEEIIVCACDDGDVVAYATRHFLPSVKNAASRSAVDRSFLPPITPLFTKNVGMSAWGLAIHKTARMIAVSANTHEISVFAFALGKIPSEDRDEDSEREISNVCSDDIYASQWSTTESKSAVDRSSHNLEITLYGHSTNIPNIAFCNTGDDPDGRYLFSIDINGETLIWDIWKREGIKRHTLPQKEFDLESSLGSRTRGWSIIALASDSFRLSEGILETFGCEPEVSEKTWDISGSRHLVKDSSQWHPAYRATPHGYTGTDVEIESAIQPNADLDDLLDVSESDVSMSDESETTVSTSNPDWIGETQHNDYGEDEEIVEDADKDSIQDSYEISCLEKDLDEDIRTEPGIMTQPATFDGINPQQVAHGSNLEISAQATEGAIPRLLGIPTEIMSHAKIPANDPGNICNEKPVEALRSSANSESPSLPFSLLYTSECDITFSPNPLAPFTIEMHEPLLQKIPLSLTHISHFERLNMIIQIPELGIVAIGSQIGRVALLTMSRMTYTGQRGLRLDWILPFKSQEDANYRPLQPLLGIAASPIQGHQSAPEPEGNLPAIENESHRLTKLTTRYRLLLYYSDHTVMSYELSRASSGGKSPEDVPVF